MALAGTKVLQKNEGKKLKFYDSAYLRYHVLRAVYDVKYFGDKGLGLRAVYVALAVVLVKTPSVPQGRLWRPVYILTSRCASLNREERGYFAK